VLADPLAFSGPVVPPGSPSAKIHLKDWFDLDLAVVVDLAR